MEQKRANILRRKTSEKERKEFGSGERAVKRARRAGVFLDPDLRCGYEPISPHDDNWIFGPDKNKDNIIKHIIKNLKKDLNIYIKIIILILHQKMILLLVFLLTTAHKY
jgi:hypothetical protein